MKERAEAFQRLTNSVETLTQWATALSSCPSKISKTLFTRLIGATKAGGKSRSNRNDIRSQLKARLNRNDIWSPPPAEVGRIQLVQLSDLYD